MSRWGNWRAEPDRGCVLIGYAVHSLCTGNELAPWEENWIHNCKVPL
jgi:hypothetical protein